MAARGILYDRTGQMAARGILYDRTGQMAAGGFGCSRETRLPGATENYPPGVLVAAAIDLGSALSGYAFAFWENPTRVFASTWSTRTTAHFQSAKTPTTLLLDPNGDFYAFGMEAEEKYSELTEDDQHHDWYYFQHFKMELYHSNKLTRHTKIKDISGKEKPAMEVFTKTIIFLKDKLYEEARISKTALEKHEIMWVITVPAIWSDGAKQFMRLAANNAGIDNYQLRLVLEPEAASLYCQVDVTRRDVQAGYVAELSSFPVGHKYILCDIGGGTADIATHEVCEDKSLRELFRASGDALGGNRVNLAFTVFLENFLGKEIFDVFKAEYRHEYLSLTREFEIKKRTFSADRATDITIMIPPALRRCIERMNTTIAVLIAEGRYQNLLQEKRDKLVLDAKLVKVFFNEPVDEIVKKLKKILEQEHFTIDSLLLVGGFADSPYVLETVSREIRQSCGNIDIRRPVEAGLHVLKGAVFSILRPNYISERVSRYSYGFRVAVPYDENIHPPGLKERRMSGKEYCEYIFHKCISKGQRLKCGDKIKDGFEAPKRDITSKNEELTTELYRSFQQDPKYCTPEEDCTRVGKMVHRPPTGGWGNIVHFSVEITIGETELKMEVINGTTGEICDTTIDFLD